MAPVVRDTLSLRPSGFYAYAFLAARAAQIAAPAITTGLAGNLLFLTSRGGQTPAATLIVAILFVRSPVFASYPSPNPKLTNHRPAPP